MQGFFFMFVCYLSVCPFPHQGPVYVLNEVVEYLEKNPQTVRIQDTMCCESSAPSLPSHGILTCDPPLSP